VSALGAVTMSTSRSWRYFAGWALVGASGAMVIAGAFTIGIVFVPIVAMGTILLSRRPAARVGVPGVLTGVGAPLLFIAFLNRSGPGMVCTATQTSFGAGQSCSQEWNPWFFLIPALAFIVASVVWFRYRRIQLVAHTCSNCGAPIEPSFNFCPTCQASVHGVSPT